MLLQLQEMLSAPNLLKRDLERYGVSGMSSVAALSKIKQAFLAAEKHITCEEKLTESKIAFYGSLQRLVRTGIDLDDVDAWHITSYKHKLKAGYQYQALLKAAKKKGYICLPRFEYILADEKFATYYDQNGIIQIDYRDEGLAKNITIENLDDYRIFFLLMNIYKNGKLVWQEKVQCTPNEIRTIKSSSNTKDKGEMVKRLDYKTRQYIIIENDEESVWQKHTKPMINKSLINISFRVIKDVLPELSEIYKFEEFDKEEETLAQTHPAEERVVEAVVERDINSPTPEMFEESAKLQEEYKITPELIDFEKARIRQGLEHCGSEKERKILISREAATIISLGDEFKEEVRKYA